VIDIGSVSVPISDNAIDLGVILDSQPCFHISDLQLSCFFQLRQLWAIRRSLTTFVAKGLAHAFISSRIDYCNSALYGATSKNLWILQSVLHAAARMVTGRRKYDHISPALRDELHWLPVLQRIEFKLCTLVFKCLHSFAPPNIAILCSPAVSNQHISRLRLAAHGDLIVPPSRTAIGARCFSVAAPRLWNNLPAEVRDPSLSLDRFKAQLKTHLFKTAYT
jgi:hypothetical protein